MVAPVVTETQEIRLRGSVQKRSSEMQEIRLLDSVPHSRRLTGAWDAALLGAAVLLSALQAHQAHQQFGRVNGDAADASSCWGRVAVCPMVANDPRALQADCDRAFWARRGGKAGA